MRRAARQEFETHYTAKVNHDRLMQIYESARERMQREIKNQPNWQRFSPVTSNRHHR